ncbi:MAG TPA: MFS transporter [Myxococcaceae bacterium]|nr:MFS transporter [Myxococcaceae bacterium]
MSARPERPLHYAWIVAATTFLTLLCAAGVRATPSILIVPLEEAFGWSRATISSAVSVNLLLYGLVGPFAAALLDRFGIRRVVAISLSVMCLGVALTSRMTQPWQLVLSWGVLVGLGTGTTATVLGATVVNRWFHERRGLVMGVLTAATATGQLVFLPLLARLVQRGWQTVPLTVAAVLAGVVPLVTLLFRDRPGDVGLLPYGASDPGDVPSPPARSPLTAALDVLRRGSRSRDFWLLFASFFVCGATTNGLVGTHLVPACMDHGIPEVRAAGLLAMMGVFDLVGTTASGWLSDRYDSRWLLFWYYGLRGLSLLYLPTAFEMSEGALAVFAVFYGLDWIATVPPTLRLATDVFGREDAAVAFGWIFAGHQIGASFGALGAGIVRTSTATYTLAFLGAGSICLVAALLVLRIGRFRKGVPAVAASSPEPG